MKRCLDEFVDGSNYMATSIKLDPVSEKRLDRLVRQTGRPKQYYLSAWIANGLDDIEDAEIAAATMERVRKGQEKVYSADEVRQDLDLGNYGEAQ